MVEGGHRGAGGVLQVLQKCPGSLVGVGRGLKRDLMAAGKISMGAGGRGSVGAGDVSGGLERSKKVSLGAGSFVGGV